LLSSQAFRVSRRKGFVSPGEREEVQFSFHPVQAHQSVEFIVALWTEDVGATALTLRAVAGVPSVRAQYDVVDFGCFCSGCTKVR
jgi:hypothetical protein